jgi:hypothetical protein
MGSLAGSGRGGMVGRMGNCLGGRAMLFGEVVAD